MRAKLARAEMHLRDTEALVDSFVAGKPYALNVEKHRHPKAIDNWEIIVTRVDPVDERILLSAGDFLTNLRAVLDHLAWDLVLASPPGLPDEHTSFPIKDKAPRQPGSGAPTSLRISGGVSAPALAVIEAAQPYARTDGGNPHEHPLWILDRLVGIDKHRHLLLVTSAYDGHTSRFIDPPQAFGGDWFGFGPFPNPIPLQPDAQVSTIFIEGATKVEVETEIAATVTIQDGEPGGGKALVAVLTDLLEKVRDEVLPSLAGYL